METRFAIALVALAAIHHSANARVYQPSTGRFLTQEPTGADGPNYYWALRNNPLRFKDPTGLMAEEDRSSVSIPMGGYSGPTGAVLSDESARGLAKSAVVAAGVCTTAVLAPEIYAACLVNPGVCEAAVTGFAAGLGSAQEPVPRVLPYTPIPPIAGWIGNYGNGYMFGATVGGKPPWAMPKQ